MYRRSMRGAAIFYYCFPELAIPTPGRTRFLVLVKLPRLFAIALLTCALWVLSAGSLA